MNGSWLEAVTASTSSLDRQARRTWAHIDDFESVDRMRPATGGALAGIIGGAMMLATADALIAGDVTLSLGRAITGAAAEREVSLGAAFLFAAVLGAVIGALFAIVTRYLRRFTPVLVWALVFFPAAWTFVHAFVLSRFPNVAHALPYAPMALGALAFAFGVSLQVPFRVRAPRDPDQF